MAQFVIFIRAVFFPSRKSCHYTFSSVPKIVIFKALFINANFVARCIIDLCFLMTFFMHDVMGCFYGCFDSIVHADQRRTMICEV